MTIQLTPAEMHERLENGLTMQEIGDLTGKTKGAVAGLIFRYRKRLEKEREKVKPAVLEEPEKPRKKEQVIEPPSLEMPKKWKKTKVTTFLQVLENGNCRYIEGDVKAKTAIYCQDQAGRSGFCEKHHAMCYKPIKQKEAA